eukprot:Blabericola_migrator_1__522@NODE_1128_length_5346_cov_67_075014_g307_i2_p4_GENE_NODE_1128_length_5346_cov_67_075014_g307_i2NODE_1128_length_5346_cov_67_075014_g307_i2_p4_ORF_typecomplete_len172_score29_40_NODE_1128_length_5346_cov_67_075014_g307_i245665081
MHYLKAYKDREALRINVISLFDTAQSVGSPKCKSITEGIKRVKDQMNNFLCAVTLLAVPSIILEERCVKCDTSVRLSLPFHTVVSHALCFRFVSLATSIETPWITLHQSLSSHSAFQGFLEFLLHICLEDCEWLPDVWVQSAFDTQPCDTRACFEAQLHLANNASSKQEKQ